MDAMKRRSAFPAALGIAGIAGIACGAAYYLAERQPVGPSPFAANPALLALMDRADAALSIGARSRSDGCAVRGPLPDPACTPGAVFLDTTVRDICTSGYTQTVRNVPVPLKRTVYAEYGLSYPQPSGAYEVDHLVPLELGGSNDIANLFPEAADPFPGFREKDLVENYLHGEVCAGSIGLPAAQKQIANDWVAVYDTLTPDDLAALRR